MVWSGGPASAEGVEGSAVEHPAPLPFHIDDASVPDLVRTPGEADGSAKAAILCQSEAKQPPHPSAALCESAFVDFHIPDERRYQYECAFIIPPSVGGASTKKNVWLQPSAEAPVKRALDRVMRKRVCDREISLVQAQTEIADDWPSAYRHLIVGDVAVAIYEPLAEEQRGSKTPQSNVSNNLFDKRPMLADFSQPDTTGAPPIEASVSLGSGQYGPQSANRRGPVRSGSAPGHDGHSSVPGRFMPQFPTAIGPYRSRPRQVRR